MNDWRIRIFTGGVYLGFILLTVQLFSLQVINGKTNRLLAEENRLKRIPLPASRGQIFDRNGNILATSQPVYRLADKLSESIDRLSALKIQEQNINSILIEPRRYYPFGPSVSHLVGYLGSVALDELYDKKLQLRGYDLTGFIGRYGVEAQYESLLKGHDGSRLVEVDTGGKISRVIGQLSAIPGKSLTMAVDLRLQQLAEQLMLGKRGAVVVSDPNNGELISLFSSPAFDPNVLSAGEDWQTIGQLLNDTNQPLFNRVITGKYPPGSTFKLITASAALSEGKITPETVYTDTGIIRVGNFSYTNWYWTGYGRTEGEISLTKALSRSTDTYFYKIGEWVGERKLIEWAKKFGVDRPYDIDLPGELGGFIGTPEWKQENRGESWFLGNTYHLAIGQGDLSLTPLAVNQVTSVFASGGKVCKPRVLKIGSENTPYTSECYKLELDQSYINTIKQGMVMACSNGGTGWPFFGFEPKVACKTGTAETTINKATHAWFTAFAPADNPTIVITVLVENGGEGSSVAGPIAKELLSLWFEDNKK